MNENLAINFEELMIGGPVAMTKSQHDELYSILQERQAASEAAQQNRLKQIAESAGNIASKADESNSEDNNWDRYANCLGVDPDLFFPKLGESTKEAKDICNSCVVRDECLEYAIKNGEKFGVWGGKSERERRSIRKQRALSTVIRLGSQPTQQSSQ